MNDVLFIPLLLSYVKGYYSFGLMETNLFDRAEEIAHEVNCHLLVLKGFRVLLHDSLCWRSLLTPNILCFCECHELALPIIPVVSRSSKQIKLNMEIFTEFCER